MAEATCSIEGCEQSALARGWCGKHYQRWTKHGDPMAPVKLRRAGISDAEADERRAQGFKWCSACKDFHLLAEFRSDRSRTDGLEARCLVSKRAKQRGRPRRMDRERAHSAVRKAIRRGWLPHPNDRPCSDCGHIWTQSERRHEYDHHLGYAPEHRLHVQPVCTICHAARHMA